MHWSEKDTFSFALMVVACEALKPSDPEFTKHNIYQVIEALLGKLIADRLRQHPFPAQWVRSSQLHAGEFHGSELDSDRLHVEPAKTRASMKRAAN